MLFLGLIVQSSGHRNLVVAQCKQICKVLSLETTRISRYFQEWNFKHLIQEASSKFFRQKVPCVRLFKLVTRALTRGTPLYSRRQHIRSTEAYLSSPSRRESTALVIFDPRCKASLPRDWEIKQVKFVATSRQRMKKFRSIPQTSIATL